MTAVNPTDNEQTKLWNGPAGRAWVETQDLLEAMFEPFVAMLLEGVAAGSGGRVLDIGCGTGSTTLAAARLLGAKGHCVGVDISEPMMAAYRKKTGVDATNFAVQGHDAALVLIEAIVPAGPQADLGKLIDLEMMLMPGGRERTEEEFDALFARTGFQMTRIIPTESPLWVIEARPV